MQTDFEDSISILLSDAVAQLSVFHLEKLSHFEIELAMSAVPNTAAEEYGAEDCLEQHPDSSILRKA